MVKIWGLDLNDMKWGKFKSSYMWNTEYHLRRTKFIVYQVAMICTVVSESLGTAALSDYIDQQNYLQDHVPGSSISNNDFIGIFSYNIFVGVYVATIFGSAFFFDLFWPQRYEARGVKMSWKICSILAILFTLSAALGCTIIVATHKAHVTGPNRQAAIQYLHNVHPNEPLVYKHNARAIASICFLWPGFVATVASTIILWHSLAHIDKYGPFSTHVGEDGTATGPGHEKEMVDPVPAGTVSRSRTQPVTPQRSQPATPTTSRPQTSTSAAAAANAAMRPQRSGGASAQPQQPQAAWQGGMRGDAYPVGTNLDGSPRSRTDAP